MVSIENAALPHWAPVFPELGETTLSGNLDSIPGLIEEFSRAYRGSVDRLDGNGLRAAFRAYEEFLAPLQQATTYAEARLAADAGDTEALALLDRCDALWNSVAERAEFFERELAALPEVEATALLHRPEIAEYANHLRKVRAASEVQPSPAAVGVLAQLDAVGGWERLARKLLDRVVVEDQGERLSLGSALPALYHPESVRRQRVCAAISAALEPEVELRGTALVELTRARIGRQRVCGLTSWLQEEYFTDQVAERDVTALLDVARAHRGLVHRYYRAKAGRFGGGLTDADRYAPAATSDSAPTWSDACDLVLRSLAPLGKTIVTVARDLLASGAVDAEPRPGKRRGALTFSMPGGHAGVLVNFTGSPRDVLTLAHELGHAIHTRLSGHHGPLNFAVPTVLAETVALFTEAVVMETYRDLAGTTAERDALTARWLEDQLVATFRQVALHDFEAALYARVGAGETPDATELGDIWLEEQSALYGPALTLSSGYRHWWSYLDNFFFAPGTRYAYTFGQLAAIALVAKQHEDPNGFRTRFEWLLGFAGSRPPSEILGEAGIDTADPRGWESGLAVLESQVREFHDYSLTPPAPSSTGLRSALSEERR